MHEKVPNCSIQLVKNGSKNESVAFIILINFYSPFFHHFQNFCIKHLFLSYLIYFLSEQLPLLSSPPPSCTSSSPHGHATLLSVLIVVWKIPSWGLVGSSEPMAQNCRARRWKAGLSSEPVPGTSTLGVHLPTLIQLLFRDVGGYQAWSSNIYRKTFLIMASSKPYWEVYLYSQVLFNNY